MKVKEGFITRKMGKETIVVATGEASKSFNGMIKLNDVGAFLFEEMIADNVEKDELVKKLTNKYDVSKEKAEDDLEGFLQPLIKAGIIK